MINALKQGCLALLASIWACTITALCGLLPAGWTDPSAAALDALPGPGGELDGLPDSAANIHAAWEDWSESSDYFLQAELPEEDFLAYIESQGFESYDGELTWNPQGFLPDWWHPPEGVENTYVKSSAELRAYAKYADGIMYYYLIPCTDCDN